ncbi:hypothetical protein C1637_16970 [Chryseobacterium lactis]|uniref:Uncharacterized protein n=1 Tax=Chryseobacterium lactis TaxID=1241981 RepID=A0A3G6RID5_CHRLC|nr:hypothetical protein [Chryseobacterium lactis]AZA84177.1 hypothetical protein EG342_20810 [Chryseobacterium lactis]AZB04565.1 hypothetical protein EG341_11690 [Chryseobacterium lactis]PNW12732.1 hypothetical protein C1637_16970 [Chryseobacterium lactis]
MNYVTAIYLLNLVIYAVYFFGKTEGETDLSVVDFLISGILSLLLIFAGYLNAKKRMIYRTVLWMFFVNVFLFICSGIFDQFGSDFNILSTNNSDSFIFTLALIAYNGYLFPLTLVLEGSGLALICPVVLSFMLPSLGYWIGKRLHSNK